MVYTIVVHLRAKPDQESISKLHAKLLEASAVYSKDKETLSWFVMQSVHDPQDFTIVERYLNEGSQKYHLSNPYWKTFDPYVIPLLEKDMDLRRFEELVPASVEASKLSTAASLKPYFNNKAFGSYPGAAAFDPLNQSYPNPAIVSINGTYTSTQTGIVYKSPGNTAP
ncbi:hypothetical protein MPDQ_005633 [Monascus purpureus]|uniref:ABM domain-containing protein n=1 Tax=Monascus purpureus TaxID=5098 RepID=A0A507QW84_MONPU|nr:hypothetical protein MPDQ_005633 [Monascus purpureus]